MRLFKKTNKKTYNLRYGLIRSGQSSGFLFLAGNFIFLFSIAIANLILPKAFASSPYNASAVLGQTSFNTAYTNNIRAPNDSGFNSDSETVVDSTHHRLFVADQGNNRVLVFLLDNQDKVSSAEASYVLGQSDFNSNSPVVTQAGMNGPAGLAYDSVNNRLFVSDTQNNRVMVYDLAGGISNGMNASNVIGQSNFTSSSPCSTVSASCLKNIFGINYDSLHQLLFVADAGDNRVLVYDLSGGISDGMDASNVLGQSSFSSSDCSTSPAINTICSPTDLAEDTDTQQLFVAAEGENRVMVYDLSGGISDGMDASNVLGQSGFTSRDVGTTASTFANGGLFITYDASHKRLFIGDQANYRVLVFDLSSGITDGMDASNVIGQSDLTSGNLPFFPTASTIIPLGLTYSPAGDSLFVSDNQRLLEFDLGGGITDGMNASNELGQSNGGSSSFGTESADNTNASAVGLNGPLGVVTDPVHHWMFVADDNNSRVLVYALDSQNDITSQTATWVLGEPDFLTNPSACGSTVGARDICGPEALAYDAGSETLFVADGNNRVLVFQLANGISNYMPANYELGEPDFSTISGGASQNLFSDPTGLAYDSTSHRLFISDWVNSRVLVYDLSGGISNGMAASNVLGQSDFTSSSACSTVNASCLSNPEGLSYDSANQRLFVADGNNRVLVYGLSGGISNGMAASNVLGQSDFGSNGSSTTQDSMFQPLGLSYSVNQKKLFVADSANNRVLVYDLSAGISDGMAASGILGQADFTSSSAATSQAGLNGVGGLSFNDSLHRLFVADTVSNRVLEFDFAQIASSLAGGTVGAHYQASLGSQTQGSTSFSLSAGNLPPGLTLSGSTGVLSGTPTTSGTYNFTIQLSDANGLAGTYNDTANYSLAIKGTSSAKAGAASGSSTTNSAAGNASASPVNLGGFGNNINGAYDFSGNAGSNSKDYKWYEIGGIGLALLLSLMVLSARRRINPAQIISSPEPFVVPPVILPRAVIQPSRTASLASHEFDKTNYFGH